MLCRAREGPVFFGVNGRGWPAVGSCDGPPVPIGMETNREMRHGPRRTRLIAPTTNVCDTAFLTPGHIRIGGPSQARPPVGLQ